MAGQSSTFVSCSFDGQEWCQANRWKFVKLCCESVFPAHNVASLDACSLLSRLCGRTSVSVMSWRCFVIIKVECNVSMSVRDMLERLADNRRPGVGTTAVMRLCSGHHDTTSRQFQFLDALESFGSLIASVSVTANNVTRNCLSQCEHFAWAMILR